MHSSGWGGERRVRSKHRTRQDGALTIVAINEERSFGAGRIQSIDDLAVPLVRAVVCRV